MLPRHFSKILDCLLIAILRRLPVRAVQRVLHLVLANPQIADRWGFFIRPRHFYEPLPDFANLDPARIKRRRESPGIGWRIEQQLETVRQLHKWAPELADAAAKYDFSNDTFTALDSGLYYTLLRKLRPGKVIEIGCGFSSQIASLALARNADEGAIADHLCIDPYPAPQLEGLPIRLLAEPIQTVPLETFETLRENDVLFIDSTHTVKCDSDVCREVLEIFPLIAPGVWIHIHDIFFPFDYPAHWILEERRAWNEQYLVEALLQGSSKFRVELAAHWLATDHPREAAVLWPAAARGSIETVKGGSLWLQKIS